MAHTNTQQMMVYASVVRERNQLVVLIQAVREIGIDVLIFQHYTQVSL